MFGTVKTNIWSIYSDSIPLKQSRLIGQITNLFAKLTLIQQHHTTTNLENVILKFPLNFLGTICGIEAQITGNCTTTVQCNVLKAKDAIEHFQKNVNKTLDRFVQSNDSDILICYVEKLPADSQLEVRVTFVTEPHFYNENSFCLISPTTICPRIYSHEMKTTSSANFIKEYQFSLDLTMTTSHHFGLLESISSPTHPITHRIFEGKNQITLNDNLNQPLTDADLVLNFTFKESFNKLLPYVLIEKYDEIKKMVYRTALALVFHVDYDKLIENEKGPSEVIIIVDCMQLSNRFALVQHAVKSALNELATQKEIKVNLIVLAAKLLPLFPQSVALTDDVLIKIKEYLLNGDFERDFNSGSRDLYTALNEFYNIYNAESESSKNEEAIQILLITNGLTSHATTLNEVISANADFFTLLPLGIGIETNIPLLNEIARISYGYSEFELNGDYQEIEKKAKKQIRRACQVILGDLVMDWGDLEDWVIQAPERLPVIFSRDYLIFYAFLKDAPEQQQFDLTLRGLFERKRPLEKKIRINLDDDVMKDNIIHLLAANERIFDLEEMIEEEEEEELTQRITKPQKYEHQEEIELIASNYGITSEQTVFFVSQKFGINHNQKTNLNTNTSSLDSSTIVLLSYDAGVLPMEEYNTELPEDQNVNKHTTHQKRIYQTDLLLQFKNICTEKPANSNIDILSEYTNKKSDLTRFQKSKTKKRPPERKKVGSSTPALNPAKKKIQNVVTWNKTNPNTNERYDETLYKRVTLLLNKLTRENFETVKNEIVDLKNMITAPDALRCVISVIFEKAVSEPNFSSLYSDLCVVLAEKFPEFPDFENPRQKITFKRLLLNRCQEEFERPTTFEDKSSLLSPEELQSKARRRTVGNITFVGELYKKGLLRPDIIHSCVRILFGMTTNSNIENMKFTETEKIELLVKLLNIVGKKLDSQPKDSGLLNNYFEVLKQYSVDKQRFESRIRFLIMNLLDLRKQNWEQQKIRRDEEEGPKKLEEIRLEVYKDSAEKTHQHPQQIAKSGEYEKKQEPHSAVSEFSRGRNSERGRGGTRGSRNFPRFGDRRGNNYHDIKKTGEQKWTTKESLTKNGTDNKAKGRKQFDVPQQHTNTRNTFALLSQSSDSISPTMEMTTTTTISARTLSSSSHSVSELNSHTPSSEDHSKTKLSVYRVNRSEREKRQSDSPRPPPPPPPSDDDEDEEKEDNFNDITDKNTNIQTRHQNIDDNQKLDNILEEYLQNFDVEDVVSSLREMNGNTTSLSEFVRKALYLSFERKDKDRMEIVKLITELCHAQLLNTQHLEHGLGLALENLSEVVVDAPLAFKYMGFIVASIVNAQYLSLNSLNKILTEAMKNGVVVDKVATETFSQLLDLSGEKKFRMMCQQSGISLRSFFTDDKEYNNLLQMHAKLKTIFEQNNRQN